MSQCKDIAGAVEQAPALVKACELALSARQGLPDILCDRVMKRTWSEIVISAGGTAEEQKYSDVVTAKVRYVDGQEHYEDVRINGRVVDAKAPQLSGTWSDGELGPILTDIFLPSAKTTFRFEKERTHQSRKALVFRYRVEAQNNRSYVLHVDSTSWYPAYGGRLWVDGQSLQLLRLERETDYMPTELMRQMKTAVDYADLTMGDKTTLVLPVQSTVLICMPPPMLGLRDICAHHSITFTNWHKFRGTVKVLPDTAH